MVASIILNTSDRKTKKGYPIVLRLFASQNRRHKKTIGHSFEEDWNLKFQEPFHIHPDYNDLIPIIKDYKAKINEIVYKKYTYELAYSLLFSKAELQKSVGLLEFILIFIEEKKKMNIQFMQFDGVYKAFAKYLNNSDIPLREVDYEWLQDFRIHKLKSGSCSEAGVVTYFRHFRTIYFEAQRRKSLGLSNDNPFTGLIKSTPRPEVIEYSTSDFKKLLNYQPSENQSNINQYKMMLKVQLLLLQFYLGGHDFADLAMWKWQNIKPGRRLVFKRFKNRNKMDGGEQVNNYICDEAVKIIETYGNKTTERIFSFIPSPLKEYNKYKNVRGNYNRFYRKLSESMGTERLSSKSMRYIFRTYAGELLIHDLIVTKIQGHRPSGVTYGYQGKISFDVQDREHLKIIDIIR